MSVNITNNGVSRLDRASRCGVSTAKNIRYAFIEDSSAVTLLNTGIKAWKSVNGSWSNVANLNPGTSLSLESYIAPSYCLNDSGTIDIIYLHQTRTNQVMGNPVTALLLKYVRFDPATDTFGTEYTLRTLSTPTVRYYTDCSYGNGSGFLQCVYTDSKIIRSGTFDAVWYIYVDLTALTPTSSTPLDVLGAASSNSYASICVERQSGKRPLIAIGSVLNGSPNLAVAQGNTENATSFTVKTGLCTGPADATYGRPQIIQDAAGNEVVSTTATTGLDRGGVNHPVVFTHPNSSAWASDWQELGLNYGNTFYNTALSAREFKKGDPDFQVIAGYTDGAFKIESLDNSIKFQGLNFTIKQLQSSLGSSPFVKSRWRNYNEKALHKVDYFYQESGDIKYAEFDMNISS